MISLHKGLEQEAYRFAKLGKIYEAQKILDTLAMLGLGIEDIEALRSNVGMTFLKNHEGHPKFGVIEPFYLRHAVVGDYKGEDRQYIGLSPYTYYRFLTFAPYYSKKYERKEFLYNNGVDLFYIYIPKDESKEPYGGLVVEAYDGEYAVLPYFDLEGLKAKAQELIAELGDVDYYVWERPKNFSMDSADYAHIQEAQTELALDHYGFNNAGVEDA